MKKLFYTLVIGLLALNTISADIPKKEKKALIDFYESTNGKEWQKKWDLNAPVETWHGVKIMNDQVVEINLFRNNLQGALPESLAKLKKLKVLNVAFNSLRGELPANITKLKNLTVFKVEMNKIKGALPEKLGKMQSLVEFTAFNNFLSGAIPASIGDIDGLKILNLSSNNLKGKIPSSLGDLAHLESLGLFENGLEICWCLILIMVMRKSILRNLISVKPEWQIPNLMTK